MDMEKVKAESDAYLSGKRADNAKVTDEALAKARPIAAGPKATWTEFWQYYRWWHYGKFSLVLLTPGLHQHYNIDPYRSYET